MLKLVHRPEIYPKTFVFISAHGCSVTLDRSVRGALPPCDRVSGFNGYIIDSGTIELNKGNPKKDSEPYRDLNIYT